MSALSVSEIGDALRVSKVPVDVVPELRRFWGWCAEVDSARKEERLMQRAAEVWRTERANVQRLRNREPILNHVVRLVAKIRLGPLLSVSGLGCLVASAWTFGTSAGLATVGMALLVLEWRTSS